MIYIHLSEWMEKSGLIRIFISPTCCLFEELIPLTKQGNPLKRLNKRLRVKPKGWFWGPPTGCKDPNMAGTGWPRVTPPLFSCPGEPWGDPWAKDGKKRQKTTPVIGSRWAKKVWVHNFASETFNGRKVLKEREPQPAFCPGTSDLTSGIKQLELQDIPADLSEKNTECSNLQAT